MLEKQINGFVAYCKVSGFKDKSLESLSLRLRQFNHFIKNCRIKRIRSIQYRHLRRFVADYKQPSIHVKKARIWSLRQFYHYLKLHGYMEENIATQMPYPKIEKTVPHFLTLSQYNRILDHCALKACDNMGLRNLIIVMMLGMLGLRTGAIVAINIQDVNLPAGLLWIREKGGIKRIIVIPRVLCVLIQSYMADRDQLRGPLFLSKRKKRLSARTLQVIFADVTAAVDIDTRLHAHLFRHTAATHLNKVAGTSITQYVLGHARRQNTAKYAH
ncbi:MAG: tyrosine-type recombinase/integrase, partial [Bacteroidetes bacterium]|nr:tyrosine-type recombinase/integrase [Bacteroidota bacterium]